MSTNHTNVRLHVAHFMIGNNFIFWTRRLWFLLELVFDLRRRSLLTVRWWRAGPITTAGVHEDLTITHRTPFHITTHDVVLAFHNNTVVTGTFVSSVVLFLVPVFHTWSLNTVRSTSRDSLRPTNRLWPPQYDLNSTK